MNNDQNDSDDEEAFAEAALDDLRQAYQGEDLDFRSPSTNMYCCHGYLKCLFCVKECVVILLSTFFGLSFLFTSLASMLFLIPTNLFLTNGLAQGGFLGSHSVDFTFNLILFVQAINNFLFSLHVLTLTKK